MGIQYRFDMTVDPEPANVKRVAWIRMDGQPIQPDAPASTAQVVMQLGGWRRDWGTVWHRYPCRRNRDMPPLLRRGESGALFGERRRKRGAKFKHLITRGSKKCPISIYGTHFHWNTKPEDKIRSWGSLRGETKVVNLDAFQRMRTQYRAKRHRRW